MRLKQILKSKSGMALENAILFMLIIFSLCALLTSLTLIGHYQLKIEKTVLQHDVEIDQIGEDFIAGLKGSGEGLKTDYENYAYNVADDGKSITVKHKDDEEGPVLLYVEVNVESTDGTTPQKVDVVKWRYSSPTK